MIKLQQQRNQLVAAIESCVLKDTCTYKPPSDLGVLFLEDIITADSFVLDCSYKQFNGSDIQGKPIKADVVTNISVNLRGAVRMADFVSVKAATLARFGPDAGTLHIIPTFPALTLSATHQGNARISATLDNAILHPDVSVTAGSIAVNNLADLTQQRDFLQNSVYSIAMQAKNGLTIQNTVGPPYGGECPITR